MLSDDEILGLWSEGKAHAPARPVLGSKKVIAFARAVEREAYKRAVAECQKIADRHWAAYKGREPLADPSMRANPYVEGESDGAGECADVIEALRSEE